MSATVNGHAVTPLPVDGGLWTAIEVGPGRSNVVLGYSSALDLVEFVLAGVGTLALLIAWLVVALVSYRRRRSRLVG
jgi:hypothetical protein